MRLRCCESKKLVFLFFLLSLPCVAQPPMPGFTLIGSVYYPDGSPAVNVSVSVENKYSGFLLWSGETDADGLFSTKANLTMEEDTVLLVTAFSPGFEGVSEVVVSGSVAVTEVFLAPVDRPIRRHSVIVSRVFGTQGCVGGAGSVVVELENDGDYAENDFVVYIRVTSAWRSTHQTVSSLGRDGELNVTLNVSYPPDARGSYSLYATVEGARFTDRKMFDYRVSDCVTSTTSSPITSSSSSTSSTTTMKKQTTTTAPASTTVFVLPETSTVSRAVYCFNEVLDEGEEEIDCGGPCAPCEEEVRGVVLKVVAAALLLLLLCLIYLLYFFGAIGHKSVPDQAADSKNHM